MNKYYILIKISVLFALIFLISCKKKSTVSNEDVNRQDDLNKSTKSSLHDNRTNSKRNEIKLTQSELLQIELHKEEAPAWITIEVSRRAKLLKEFEYKFDASLALQRNYLQGVSSLTIGDNSYRTPDDFQANAVSHAIVENMIVLRKNTESRIYKIENGALKLLSDMPLPKFNYGEDRRWYLSDWQWLSSSLLVAVSNEENPETDMIADSRLYLYDLDAKSLSRVRLPDVIDSTAGISIHSIEGNNIHLRNRNRIIRIELD
jgi:hypothetical protein